MKTVQKEYTQSFLVEPTKLTRLMALVHERIGQSPATLLRDRFEVFLPANRVEALSSLDEVLALENSRKKRIERLLIVCSGDDQSGTVQYQVEIDFGVVKTPLNSPPNTHAQKMIAVTVMSDDSPWNARVLSEIEEQIERTRLGYIPSYLTILGIAIALVILMFAAGPRIVVTPNRDLSNVMWLDDSSRARVEKILSDGHTLTDQEMREINPIQLRNLIENQKPPLPPKGQTRRLMLVGLPVLFLPGCIIGLIFTYPTTVFLWGDEKESYANLRQRRNILWGLIIGVVLVGMLSKFLYEGLAPLIPK